MSWKYVTHFSRDFSLGQIRIYTMVQGGGKERVKENLNLKQESMRALMSVHLHLCLSQHVSLFLDNIAEVNL